MNDQPRDERRKPGVIDTGSLAEMGLLRRPSPPAGDLESRDWSVDVFLGDCSISGTIAGRQRRLGDYLMAIDDMITINNAAVRSLRGGADILKRPEAIVMVPTIVFIVDCTETTVDPASASFKIERRTETVTLNVGPFWIRGQLHVPPSGNVISYIRTGSGNFIPLTDIRVSGQDQHNGRTLLLNRNHLRCLLT